MFIQHLTPRLDRGPVKLQVSFGFDYIVFLRVKIISKSYRENGSLLAAQFLVLFQKICLVENVQVDTGAPKSKTSQVS